MVFSKALNNFNLIHTYSHINGSELKEIGDQTANSVISSRLQL